jgi:hydroxymethylglutaryl-CoA lyase
MVTLTALVPNVRGAELALEAGMRKLSATVSASNTYSERNVRMTTEESIGEVASVCALASGDAVPVDAVLSCAFGSPYEGDIAPDEVRTLRDRLRSIGAASVTLADTTGMATPRIIGEVLSAVGPDVGLHLHDTRGTALLNLYTALVAGVTRFDTAIGGLGGSPFAHGAGGNVATEEVVALLDDLQVSTGIDLEALLAASRQVEELIGHPVPGRVAHVGPRTRLSGTELSGDSAPGQDR